MMEEILYIIVLYLQFRLQTIFIVNVLNQTMLFIIFSII